MSGVMAQYRNVGHSMTLAPGESTYIEVEIPPELAEELGELAENGATVTFEAGSTTTEGDS